MLRSVAARPVKDPHSMLAAYADPGSRGEVEAGAGDRRRHALDHVAEAEGVVRRHALCRKNREFECYIKTLVTQSVGREVMIHPSHICGRNLRKGFTGLRQLGSQPVGQSSACVSRI
jgi:hypothetical protein